LRGAWERLTIMFLIWQPKSGTTRSFRLKHLISSRNTCRRM
jgi:hypothetical protein